VRKARARREALAVVPCFQLSDGGKLVQLRPCAVCGEAGDTIRAEIRTVVERYACPRHQLQVGGTVLIDALAPGLEGFTRALLAAARPVHPIGAFPRKARKLKRR
jgi:hypothetical protein